MLSKETEESRKKVLISKKQEGRDAISPTFSGNTDGSGKTSRVSGGHKAFMKLKLECISHFSLDIDDLSRYILPIDRDQDKVIEASLLIFCVERSSAAARDNLDDAFHYCS